MAELLAGDVVAMVAEDTPASSEAPHSLESDSPVIITLAPPKPMLHDKLFTADEGAKLRAALQTNSISKMAQAIRTIKVLSLEIRKQNSQALVPSKSKAQKRQNTAREVNESGDGATGGPLTIKKRAPRSQPAERKRPWKPERLDPTKPILQCDACGYQANRRDYMRRHQIRVHSDYRPYQCTLCDFKTTEKHDLDRHMNSKYHGGKGLSQKRQKMTATVKIKCDQCNYSTKSVNSILKHKQVHALERQQLDAMSDDDEEEGRQRIGGDSVVTAEPHHDNTDSMDASDPVTVMLMNDLMAAEQASE